MLFCITVISLVCNQRPWKPSNHGPILYRFLKQTAISVENRKFYTHPVYSVGNNHSIFDLNQNRKIICKKWFANHIKVDHWIPSDLNQNHTDRGGTSYEKLWGRKAPEKKLHLPSHYSSLPPVIGGTCLFAPPHWGHSFCDHNESESYRPTIRLSVGTVLTSSQIR